MISSLILFPLVSGYYILWRLRIIKYRQQRYDNQRYLLSAYFWGASTLLPVFLLRYGIKELFPWMWQKLLKMINVMSGGIHIPLLGTMAATLLITIVVVEIWNFCVDEKTCIIKAIKNEGSPLEQILLTGIDTSTPLLFTLKNDKVYIGYVKNLPIPAVDTYTVIFPLKSGFRNDDKETIINVNYTPVYEQHYKMGQPDEDKEKMDNVTHVLPYEQIVTVAVHDRNLFEEFQHIKTS